MYVQQIKYDKNKTTNHNGIVENNLINIRYSLIEYIREAKHAMYRTARDTNN